VQVLDPERGAALEKEEASRADRQEVTLSHDSDGGHVLYGRFGAVDGGLVETVLSAVSAPRPRADGTPDPRSAAQRRAEGLVELLKAALVGQDIPESGGEPVAMTVTTSAEYLRQTASEHDDLAASRCCATDGASVPPATLETARRSPPRPRAASAATPGWSLPSSAPPQRCSTSAG
jgi:hypothetical protein